VKTVSETITSYLENVKLSRSAHTAATYHNALKFFVQVLETHHIDIQTTPINQISEEYIIWLAQSLKVFAATTEKLYLTAVNGFYEFIAAENLADVNLPKIKLLIHQRGRRPGQRLPQFPAEQIEQIIYYLLDPRNCQVSDEMERIRWLRDRAFSHHAGRYGFASARSL